MWDIRSSSRPPTPLFLQKPLRLRPLAFLLALLFLLTALTGCQPRDEDDASPASAPEDKILVGVTFDSFVMERWQRDRDILLASCAELGMELNVQNANGDPEEQRHHIDYFQQLGCDAILVNAIEPERLRPSLERAHQKGIKIIAYDRPLPGIPTDLYVSFDNERVGSLAAEAIVAASPQGGNVAIIRGASTDYNTVLAAKGFYRVMEEHRGFKVLFDEHAEEWSGEAAYDLTLEALDHATKMGKKLDFIYCGNDALAVESIRALSTRRLVGKVQVTGQDADLTACQQLVEGSQLMTVYKSIDRLAHMAAESAYRLVTEGKPPEGTTTLEIAGKAMPALLIEPIGITLDNLDDVIIEGGFHSYEDVYRAPRPQP